MAEQIPRTIQELTTSTDYGDNDYLVISNNLTGQDRKIVKQSFVDSIGNPTIDGYTSAMETPDNYTLTPSTGEPAAQYHDGMTVSFVADADSIGAVQVKIAGGLGLKSLFQLGTATTSTIVTGNYYEAVYIGDNTTGGFFQTNVQAESLPTVTGYTSASVAVDEITLTPANGIQLGAYFDGMVVEFDSPITNTGLPKLKIGALAPKDFYKFGQITTEAPFVNGDHYRATYVAADNAFYQTNLVEANLFTNEYLAVGTVALDELSTTYQLTSAIGDSFTSYYDGMSALFTADIASKGVVFINIDGLGDQVLNDGDEDFIANNLYPGQLILGKYNGTNFIKHRFSVINPPAPPIDPDLPIPDENLVFINVGTAFPLQKVNDAINNLIEEFGTSGGNRIAKITMHTGADPTTDLATEGDLSWITITTDSQFLLPSLIGNTAIFTSRGGGEFPEIGGDYIIPNNQVFLYMGARRNKIRGATFLGSGTGSVLVRDMRDTLDDKLTIDNVSWSGEGYILELGAHHGAFKIKGCSFDGFTSTIEILRTKTVIEDSVIIGDVSSGNAVRFAGCDTTITNTTITNNDLSNACVSSSDPSSSIFTDCRIGAAPGQSSVSSTNGSIIRINGGDYRTTSLTTEPQNILSDGSGTIVRLQNSPTGGSSSTNGGQIIVI